MGDFAWKFGPSLGSPVTPPADTWQNVSASGTANPAVTPSAKTFSAFTDPGTLINNYNATITTVIGSGSISSGSGRGPYAVASVKEGDGYVIVLDARDASNNILASAVHTVTVQKPGGTDTIASAGAQQTKNTFVVVTLDGSDSSSGTYAWVLKDPLGVTRTSILSSATAKSPTFTPDLTGTWLATITVDGGDNSDTTSVIVGDPVFGLVFNPIAATKNDANSLENSAPVAAGDAGFYTYAFDADTSYTDVEDMLIYYAAIPGIGFDDIFSISLFLEMQSETDTRLCFSAVVTSAPTGLASANGVYGGVNEEGTNTYDHYVKNVNTSIPNTGNSSANPPMYVMRYFHNPSRTSMDGVLYDQSTSPWTYRNHDTAANDTSPTTSGTVYIGVLVTTRTNKSDTETFQGRLRYRVDLNDAA